jgi:hypothetical protein
MNGMWVRISKEVFESYFLLPRNKYTVPRHRKIPQQDPILHHFSSLYLQDPF